LNLLHLFASLGNFLNERRLNNCLLAGTKKGLHKNGVAGDREKYGRNVRHVGYTADNILNKNFFRFCWSFYILFNFDRLDEYKKLYEAILSKLNAR
jgi:hypothetical protein